MIIILAALMRQRSKCNTLRMCAAASEKQLFPATPACCFISLAQGLENAVFDHNSFCSSRDRCGDTLLSLTVAINTAPYRSEHFYFSLFIVRMPRCPAALPLSAWD